MRALEEDMQAQMHLVSARPLWDQQVISGVLCHTECEPVGHCHVGFVVAEHVRVLKLGDTVDRQILMGCPC